MRSKIIFAATVAGFLLTGCGDKAESPATAVPSTTTATAAAPTTSAAAAVAATEGSADDALKGAAQAYSDAFLTGRAEQAYDLLSERCRKRTSLAEFTGIVTAAESMYGSALPFETFSAQVSGDLARVTYTYSVKAINQDAEPWTREGGDWHQDDC